MEVKVDNVEIIGDRICFYDFRQYVEELHQWQVQIIGESDGRMPEYLRSPDHNIPAVPIAPGQYIIRAIFSDAAPDFKVRVWIDLCHGIAEGGDGAPYLKMQRVFDQVGDTIPDLISLVDPIMRPAVMAAIGSGWSAPIWSRPSSGRGVA